MQTNRIIPGRNSNRDFIKFGDPAGLASSQKELCDSRVGEGKERNWATKWKGVKHLGCVLLTAAVFAFNLAAQNAGDTHPITLAEAIHLALENNLSVQIQRLDPVISQLNLTASYGNYYDPQIGFNMTHSFRSQPGGVDEFGRDLGNREVESDSFGPSLSGQAPTGLGYSISAGLSGTQIPNPVGKNETFNGDWSIQLSQPLLRNAWIDNGRANIRVNKKLLQISELGLVFQIMNTVSQVEQSYHNLIAARENVVVAQTALALAEQTLMQNRKKVEVGAMAQLDEKEAESQVATSKADLIASQRNVSLRENALKGLLTSDYASMHGMNLVPAENLVAVPVVYDLQVSWHIGLTQRPDLQQQKLDLERIGITLKLQKNQTLPQLDLIGSYGQNGFSGTSPLGVEPSYSRALSDLGRSESPSYTVGGRFSIPMGNIGARARHKAAKAQNQQTVLRLKQLEQSIMIEIDNAMKQAQASFDRIEATRQARLFAQAALDAEQKKLENGKSTSFLVLQFQQRLTSAKFSEISALADYNISLSQLALSEGTTLEKHRLNVTFE
ncbi:MAG: TolC family protein [Verrucomicrobia bacterium]|nr:TolC family protein [Verrucomicrobiota bacterium]